jgi:hypothetical protein
MESDFDQHDISEEYLNLCNLSELNKEYDLKSYMEMAEQNEDFLRIDAADELLKELTDETWIEKNSSSVPKRGKRLRQKLNAIEVLSGSPVPYSYLSFSVAGPTEPATSEEFISKRHKNKIYEKKICTHLGCVKKARDGIFCASHGGGKVRHYHLLNK